MIGIIQANGMSCPVIFCDVCHQPITSVAEGAVVYRRLDDERKIQTPLIVHRNTQEIQCVSAAAQYIEENGGAPMAQPLDGFLTDLFYNLTTKKEEQQ